MSHKPYHNILWKIASTLTNSRRIASIFELCRLEFQALTELSILKCWKLATAQCSLSHITSESPVTMSRHSDNVTAWMCHNVTVTRSAPASGSFQGLFNLYPMENIFFQNGWQSQAVLLCFFWLLEPWNLIWNLIWILIRLLIIGYRLLIGPLIFVFNQKL